MSGSTVVVVVVEVAGPAVLVVVVEVVVSGALLVSSGSIVDVVVDVGVRPQPSQLPMMASFGD